MNTLTRRKPAWTVEQWDRFAARCRKARSRLEDLRDELPRTPGNRPAVDGFISVGNALWSAMLAMELLIVDQHPVMEPRAVEFVHGPDGADRIRKGGLDGGDLANLTRDQWTAFAGKLAAWRSDAIDLGRDLADVRGSEGIVHRFHKIAALARVRSSLAQIAKRQHPGWEEAEAIFCEHAGCLFQPKANNGG